MFASRRQFIRAGCSIASVATGIKCVADTSTRGLQKPTILSEALLWLTEKSQEHAGLIKNAGLISYIESISSFTKGSELENQLISISKDKRNFSFSLVCPLHNKQFSNSRMLSIRKLFINIGAWPYYAIEEVRAFPKYLEEVWSQLKSLKVDAPAPLVGFGNFQKEFAEDHPILGVMHSDAVYIGGWGRGESERTIGEILAGIHERLTMCPNRPALH